MSAEVALEESPYASAVEVADQLSVAAEAAVDMVSPAMAAGPQAAVGKLAEVAAEGVLEQAWAVPSPS